MSIFGINFVVKILELHKRNTGADTMQGTATDDDIRGYNIDDIINRLQGSDEIEGQQGNDFTLLISKVSL